MRRGGARGERNSPEREHYRKRVFAKLLIVNTDDGASEGRLARGSDIR